MAREVIGTFTVPCYLKPNCEASTDSRFDLNRGGVPTRQGNYQANFDCMIPHSAVDAPGAGPARASYYGHGLLGSAHEAVSAPQKSLGNTHNFVICATNELGLSNPDIPHDVGYSGTSASSPSSPTAFSRASSTSCCWAG